MKNGKHFSFIQRFLALALVVAMAYSFLPTDAFAATGDAQSADSGITTEADKQTLDRHETIYGDNTKNAGKITVGKSVSDGQISFDLNGDGTNDRTFTPEDNNFLVTITQSGQIMGLASQSSQPVDVVFVLDTSGSMEDESRATNMVEAANSAIKTILGANANNRVGVVAFSDIDSGGGTSEDAAANVLTPLGHYSTDSDHLTWSGSLIQGRGTTTESYFDRDSRQWQTRVVPMSRYGANGGTNIQAGVTLGGQMLAEATETSVTVDGKSVTRMPFLVILSDGAPTYTFTDSTWYAPDQNSGQQGPGNDNGTLYAGSGFLPALTAAYYKGKITEHYYGTAANSDDRCYVYTMGVALNDRGDASSLAHITLNPAKNFVSGSANSFYSTFNSYWNSYNASSPSAFNVKVDSGDNGNYSISASSITATKNAVLGISSAKRTMYTGGLAYNDQYFEVDDVSEMTKVFTDLVNTISQKAMSAPTKVTTPEDYSGYVTFTDPIGEYMEVKDMLGVMADGNFYQGIAVAKRLGGVIKDAAFDDTFRQALVDRLGVTGSNIDVDAFIASAVASTNQAYYNSDSDYDNSIVWWGNGYTPEGEEDELVQCLGWASDDSIEYIEQAKAAGNVVPAGADYVCRSYFYYGTADDSVDKSEREFLYFVVRVQRSLEAPYQETVVISAPASLLSTERVLITESNGSYSAVVEEAQPARVIYEVGLRSDINAQNVATILAADEVGQAYMAEKPNGGGTPNVDGNDFYFFTNDWDRSKTLGSHERAEAHATFDAAEDNSFYTYQKNTALYQGNALVTGSTRPAAGTYTYVREYYTWGTTANEDGSYTAQKTSEHITVRIDDPSILVYDDEQGAWCIPAGLYTAVTLQVVGDDVEKQSNITGTSTIVAHPTRTGDANNSHYTVYLGNNGVLKLTSDPPKSVNINNSAVNGDGESVMVGDELTYNIKVVNHEAAVADAVVTDTVPKGTALATDDSGNYIISDGGQYNENTGVITWNLSNIAAGATKTVSFTVVVTDEALSGAVQNISNAASITIGNNPAYTTNTTNNPPEGKKVGDANGNAVEGVKVGDILTYTIQAVNSSDSRADITITDIIPKGTVYVEGSAAHLNAFQGLSNGVLTWKFTDVGVGASVTVSFQVLVTAEAASNAVGSTDKINNNATIQVGNDPAYTTNPTETELYYGDVAMSKTVDKAGAGVDNKTFTLKLSHVVSGAANIPALHGVYNYTIGNSDSVAGTVTFNNGVAAVSIKAGQTIVIQDLPAGVVLAVTEDTTNTPGYTPTSITPNQITVTKDSKVEVAVTNTYSAAATAITLLADKSLSGRTLIADRYSFVVEENGTPVSTGYNEADGDIVFRTITYTEPGEHTYNVYEVTGSETGVTYDKTVHTVKVTVTDNGSGALVAAVTVNGTAVAVGENGNVETGIEFKNSYTPDDLLVVLNGTKNLTGRALKDKEFTFVVKDTSGNVVTSGTNDVNGLITFNAIEYNFDDMTGVSMTGNHLYIKTFNYTVSEVIPDVAKDPYMEYSKVNHSIQVEVTYDAVNALWSYQVKDSTGAVIANNDTKGTLVFTNVQYPNFTTVKPGATKVTVNGEHADANATFSFIVSKLVKGENNALVWQERGTGTAAVSNTGVNVNFSQLTIAEAGTHYFLIQEANAGKEIHGIKYDADAYVMEVVVNYENFQLIVDTNSIKYYNYDSTAAANNYKGTEINGVPQFDNTYNASGSITLSAGKQLLDSKGNKMTMTAGDFSFELVGEDGTVHVGVLAADGTVTFGTLYYSVEDLSGANEKIFTYTMREVKGVRPGVTYDDSVYTVKVKVSNTTSGALNVVLDSVIDANNNVVTFNGNHTGVTFNNSYAPVEGDSITINATKELSGRPLREGEFAFRLYHVADESTVITDDMIPVVSATNKVDRSITITREYPATTVPGTYTYKLVEVIGNTPGVTYDKTVYTFQVEIEDDGQGGLNAKIIYNGETVGDTLGGLTFTNSYKPTAATFTPEATKVLTGRDMKDNEFSFVIEPMQKNETTQKWEISGQAVSTGESKANGTISFAPLTFSGTGDYYFAISEVKGNLGGVRYTDEVIYLKVTVGDNTETGKLEAKGAYYSDASFDEQHKITGDKVSFTNTYKPAATDLVLTGTKALTGRDLQEGMFEFLLEGNDVSQRVKNTADGSIKFEKITLTTAGTHTFTVKEVDGQVAGYTYDTVPIVVTVVVADNGTGNLYVENVSYTENGAAVNGIAFQNSYKPAEITLDLNTALDVNKTVSSSSGVNYSPAGFIFDVYNASREIVATGTSDVNGNVTFDKKLTFKAADLFRFFIVERTHDPVSGDDIREDGVSYDSTYWEVLVQVDYDAKEGKLVISSVNTYVYDAPAAQDEGTVNNTINFVNVYEPDAVTVDISLKKELSGRALVAGEFFFHLVDSNGVILDETTNDAAGNVSFHLSFTEIGEHEYTIHEHKPAMAVPGVSYDETTYKVKVVVSDAQQDGKLEATVTGIDGDNVFVNTYTAASVKAVVQAHKILTGKAMSADEFTFKLVGEGKDLTATNTADGKISFELEYAQAGTYEYILSEVAGSNTGIAYDANTYKVTVLVKDDLKGQLTATVSYALVEGNDEIAVSQAVFTNAYTVDAVNAVIKAVKKLDGKDLDDGEFTFELLDADKNVIAEATNAADGSITFKDIDALKFDAADTRTFYIREKDTGKGGVTYDDTVYEVTVTVTDNGDGTLTAGVTYSTEVNGVSATVSEALFTNSYKANLVLAEISVDKTLTGRDLKDGEFNFKLVDENGDTTYVTNQNGKVAYKLAFGSVGEYKFTLSEVAGESGDGITYDKTVYDIVVTVTDNGHDGQLDAEVAYSVDGKAVEEPAFANTYKPSTASVQISADKTMTGRDLTEGEFQFKLVKVDTNATILTRNDAEGNVTFNLALTEAGEYEFVLTEVKDSASGVSYDDSEYIVKVSVTDNLEGELEAEVTYAKVGSAAVITKPAFANSYKAGSTTAIIKAEKNLTGKSMSIGEFSFVLEGDSGKIIKANDAKGNVSYTLTYDTAGVYTYTLSEAKGTNKGITYDESVYTVTVEVKDDLKGRLNATVSYSKDGKAVAAEDVAFNNTYKAAAVTAEIKGNKTLTGKDLTAGEFTFELEDASGKVLTKTNDAKGNFTFRMSYSAVGEYTYTLREKNTGNGGVSFDESSYKVVVKVTDPGNGQLVAVVSYPDGSAIFGNSYKAASVKATIEAEKTLTGKTMSAGEFSFALVDASGKAITKTNDAEGNVSYTLTYDTAGEYIYTLSEVEGSNKGITYDESVYTVTVKVEDDLKGQLNATVSYSKDGKTVAAEDVDFVNTYKAAAVTAEVVGTKTLEGKQLNDGEFTFELLDSAENVIAETANDADGNVVFKNIAELKFDTAGEYTFYVREKDTGNGGVDFDDSVYTAVVTVTDPGDGQLVAGVTYPDGYADFANSYKAAPVGVTVEAEKNLAGRDMEQGEFSFALVDWRNNTIITTNDAEGKLGYNLVFSKVGEYAFTLSELAGEAGDGVTYDDTVYDIVVTVTDPGDGQLVADVAYANGTASVDELVFDNSYKAAPVSVQLTADKTLNGRPMNEGEFQFKLVKVDTNTTILTRCDAEGNVIFNLAFTKAGEYEFALSEVAGTASGVTYDASEYVIKVSVTDNLEGELEANVTYTKVGGTEPVDEPSFVNTYVPAAAATVIKAEKTLTGKDMAANEFQFALVDARGNTILTNNAADGTVTYNLVFGKAGVYEFVLSEVAGGNKGITYDESVYTVTVNVVDDLNGQLIAEVAYEKDGQAVAAEDVDFTNTYKAAAVQAEIYGSKTLEGKDLAAGEFTFQLVDSTGTVVGESFNDAEGKVVFAGLDALVFDEAGEFIFTVREKNTGNGGVSFDDSVYTAVVTVTDPGDGQLVAGVTYPDGYADFSNSYKAAPVTVTIAGEKTLTGRTLENGEFTFALVDQNDNTVLAANDAKGNFSYELTFTKAGEYTYLVYEVDSAKEDITYDTAVYSVKVVVTDNGEGKLVAEVTYPDGVVAFENVYTAKDEAPKTGDEAPVGIVVVVLIICLAAIVILLVTSKKRRK